MAERELDAALRVVSSRDPSLAAGVLRVSFPVRQLSGRR